MKRIKAIIAAGALTGIVLITVLALGLRSLNAWGGPAAGDQAATTTDIQTLLTREEQYQQQLDAANQTIRELQSRQSQPAFEREHEEYEEYDD